MHLSVGCIGPGFSGVFLLGNLMKNVKLFALMVIASLSALVAPAYAVIDVTVATTGIADAQVAVLATLSAMIVMAAAVYGVRKVLRLLGR